jgi:NADH:quinone reductase (non-electrogenic)
VTFVLVGAGPTGVEMAGALAILVRRTLRSEFRRVDPTSARVVLIDMAPRVLGPFIVAGERIASKTVIWTAGVAPSPAGKWLREPTDRAGRVRVQPDSYTSGHISQSSVASASSPSVYPRPRRVRTAITHPKRVQ